MPQVAFSHLCGIFSFLQKVTPLNTPSVSSTRSHRLDAALFWLRWLFLAGVVLLVLLAEKAVLGDESIHRSNLWISLGIGAAGNLLLGLLILIPGLNERVLGTFGVLLDITLAALFYWVYRGALPPLVALGTLAVLAASVRFGWRGLIPAITLLAGVSVFALWQAGDLDDKHWINWGFSFVLLATFGVLGIILRHGGRLTLGGRGSADPREIEAQRLRTARERARAIFEMASTLSSTLDHRRVLEEAQNLGILALRDELESGSRLISAVMLFQGEDNKLRVITSRGLTRNDDTVAVPGRKGILGLALKGGDPVFAGDVAADPELRYFAAFQDMKSVLAIPLRAGFDMFGVMVFGCSDPNAFSDDHVELMTAIGTQSTLSLQNAVLYQNLRTEKDRIVGVEEDARKKLSRDLHDGPTQSVAAIAMRVNYIRRLIERQPQQAVEELWKVEELARRTTKEIRHMLFTLRPLVLETQGLLAALQQLADKMKDTHDTNVIIEGQPDVEAALDTNAQGVLFYIVEEAVNNARKHAQSEHIWVRLIRREGLVVTEIEDDGVGFDVGAVDASYDQRGSLGMVNMRERAELIEGTLRIQSAKGSGTKISVLVPIHPAGGPEAAGGESEPAQPLQLQSQRTGAAKPAVPDVRSSPAASPAQETSAPAYPSRPKAPAGAAPNPRPRPGTGPLRAAAEQADRPAVGPQRSPAPTPPPGRPVTAPARPSPSDSQITKPKTPAPPSSSPQPGLTRPTTPKD